MPLVLSVPGGSSDPGDEVVLAAGAPEGGAAEDGGAPADGEANVSLEAAPVDEATTADEDRATRGPSTTWRTRTTTASGASKRAAAGGAAAGSGSKAKSKTTPTTKKRAPAAAQVTAAKVATARAAVAPPVTAAPAPPPPPPPAPVVAPVAAPAPGADSAWDRLAVCESANTNDHGAPYYGYWQFSAASWHSLGEPGLPDEHSRERQLAAAKRLHATRGWAPWPDCSRRLGLR